MNLGGQTLVESRTNKDEGQLMGHKPKCRINLNCWEQALRLIVQQVIKQTAKELLLARRRRIVTVRRGRGSGLERVEMVDWSKNICNSNQLPMDLSTDSSKFSPIRPKFKRKLDWDVESGVEVKQGAGEGLGTVLGLSIVKHYCYTKGKERIVFKWDTEPLTLSRMGVGVGERDNRELDRTRPGKGLELFNIRAFWMGPPDEEGGLIHQTQQENCCLLEEMSSDVRMTSDSSQVGMESSPVPVQKCSKRPKGL